MATLFFHFLNTFWYFKWICGDNWSYVIYTTRIYSVVLCICAQHQNIAIPLAAIPIGPIRASEGHVTQQTVVHLDTCLHSKLPSSIWTAHVQNSAANNFSCVCKHFQTVRIVVTETRSRKTFPGTFICTGRYNISLNSCGEKTILHNNAEETRKTAL